MLRDEGKQGECDRRVAAIAARFEAARGAPLEHGYRAVVVAIVEEMLEPTEPDAEREVEDV